MSTISTIQNQNKSSVGLHEIKPEELLALKLEIREKLIILSHYLGGDQILRRIFVRYLDELIVKNLTIQTNDKKRGEKT
jgi:hypothetical protein